MARALRAAGCIAAAAMVSACAPQVPAGPSPLRLGEDACSRCRMIISEERFAAQSLDDSGEVRKYDDIGCLVLDRKESGRSGGRSWVADCRTGEWIDSARAVYVHAANLITPMGYGIAAVSAEDAARSLAEESEGQVVLFEEVAARVRNHIRKQEIGS